MADDKIDYQKLTQKALRGVVRSALELAESDGLPGDHHFYIAFSTGAPGVQISTRLRERYPEEMTIVLQHQFWDLDVGADKFSVKLSFNNTPEALVVPYAAVKGFLDPSVQFGLQFETGAPVPGTPTVASALEGAMPIIATKDDETGETAEDKDSEDGKADTDGEEAPAKGDVVSLDAFRKK